MERKPRLNVKPGDKFGRLTVIAFDHYDKHKRKHFLCRCECGTEKTIQGSLLTSGNTQSCGCLSLEVKKAKRLPENKGVINHIILQYKRHARDRGLSWELSYEDVERLIKAPCFYCGAFNSNHKVTKNCKEGFDHNGIDRIDSAAGYVPDNVVPCCKTCNSAKLDMSQREFISWIQRAAEHISKQINL